MKIKHRIRLRSLVYCFSHEKVIKLYRVTKTINNYLQQSGKVDERRLRWIFDISNGKRKTFASLSCSRNITLLRTISHENLNNLASFHITNVHQCFSESFWHKRLGKNVINAALKHLVCSTGVREICRMIFHILERKTSSTFKAVPSTITTERDWYPSSRQIQIQYYVAQRRSLFVTIHA